eukprot:TRINITY_DN63883_c0_g2_i1.p1 TRINITY_DN63883_c0_g2~~TRINITY_DN63883_c0_g2_i1.p1  ORF type:complete len:1062 (+),score=158.24 TRINITY_DN63883_c0_g2_i1:103-3186(+)
MSESNGRPDEVVAAESWGKHLQRNDSPVVDLFHGQLKSTVACTECEKVSVTFDPFVQISLPLYLSGARWRAYEVTLYRDDLKNYPVTQYKVALNISATVGTLTKAVAEMTGLDMGSLYVHTTSETTLKPDQSLYHTRYNEYLVHEVKGMADFIADPKSYTLVGIQIQSKSRGYSYYSSYSTVEDITHYRVVSNDTTSTGLYNLIHDMHKELAELPDLDSVEPVSGEVDGEDSSDDSATELDENSQRNFVGGQGAAEESDDDTTSLLHPGRGRRRAALATDPAGEEMTDLTGNWPVTQDTSEHSEDRGTAPDGTTSPPAATAEPSTTTTADDGTTTTPNKFPQQAPSDGSASDDHQMPPQAAADASSSTNPQVDDAGATANAQEQSTTEQQKETADANAQDEPMGGVGEEQQTDNKTTKPTDTSYQVDQGEVVYTNLDVYDQCMDAKQENAQGSWLDDDPVPLWDKPEGDSVGAVGSVDGRSDPAMDDFGQEGEQDSWDATAPLNGNDGAMYDQQEDPNWGREPGPYWNTGSGGDNGGDYDTYPSTTGTDKGKGTPTKKVKKRKKNTPRYCFELVGTYESESTTYTYTSYTYSEKYDLASGCKVNSWDTRFSFPPDQSQYLDSLPPGADSVILLQVDWHMDYYDAVVDCYKKEEKHESWNMKVDQWGYPEVEALQLSECLDFFGTREQLGEDDEWYCPSCKQHIRAMKQLQLYRIPKILVIALKRFEWGGQYSRNKLEHAVDFPLEGLDVRQWLVDDSFYDKGCPEEDRESETIYDLFAVSNHYGGMCGGHYTAYAKAADGNWYDFDDSRYTEVYGDPVTTVVTPAAYSLFYVRRQAVKDENLTPPELLTHVGLISDIWGPNHDTIHGPNAMSQAADGGDAPNDSFDNQNVSLDQDSSDDFTHFTGGYDNGSAIDPLSTTMTNPLSSALGSGRAPVLPLTDEPDDGDGGWGFSSHSRGADYQTPTDQDSGWPHQSGSTSTTQVTALPGSVTTDTENTSVGHTDPNEVRLVDYEDDEQVGSEDFGIGWQ